MGMVRAPAMTTPEILVLCSAAAAAGFVNAIAGGGTLLTFPALLAFGVPAVVANATSTLALVVGIGGSVYGYRAHMPAVRHWLPRFVPVSLAGGALGAWLLTRTSETFFAALVPYLILFSTLIFMAQGPIRRFAGFGAAGEGAAGNSRHAVWAAVPFQFVVAVYGGYFGAGIGILMLASLCFLGHEDIREMNALKTILGALINVVAAGWFVVAGLVDWPRMGVMAAGAVVGYYLGAHFTRSVHPKVVRGIINVTGLLLAAYFFWERAHVR